GPSGIVGASGSRTPRRTWSRKGIPSTYSMVKNQVPASQNSSCRETRLGCGGRSARARNSWRKRARAVGSTRSIRFRATASRRRRVGGGAALGAEAGGGVGVHAQHPLRRPAPRGGGVGGLVAPAQGAGARLAHALEAARQPGVGGGGEGSGGRPRAGPGGRVVA